MRKVSSISDIQIVLNDLLNWKDLLTSKAKDQRGLQIKNAGDATDPTDLVTLRQLPIIGAPKKSFAFQKKASGAGEFSFQTERISASSGTLVMTNNFSVDIAQKQRVNFCYTPDPIVGSNLVVNLKITPDEGVTWELLEVLTIPVGSKHSWGVGPLPKNQVHPYDTSNVRILNPGDQLNFTVESGTSIGLTIKMDTYA
jgi:hypothetical protein